MTGSNSSKQQDAVVRLMVAVFHLGVGCMTALQALDLGASEGLMGALLGLMTRCTHGGGSVRAGDEL